jgi:hypothetical protein
LPVLASLKSEICNLELAPGGAWDGHLADVLPASPLPVLASLKSEICNLELPPAATRLVL